MQFPSLRWVSPPLHTHLHLHTSDFQTYTKYSPSYTSKTILRLFSNCVYTNETWRSKTSLPFPRPPIMIINPIRYRQLTMQTTGEGGLVDESNLICFVLFSRTDSILFSSIQFHCVRICSDWANLAKFLSRVNN